MVHPSPSGRPSSILGSLLLKKCASPDTFNVYNTKGSARRRGISKGKTDKKPLSHTREPSKTSKTVQSNSSSLVRNNAASGMQASIMQTTKSAQLITQGILNSRLAQATNSSHSRPAGPMISRNMAANRGSNTAGKIQ